MTTKQWNGPELKKRLGNKSRQTKVVSLPAQYLRAAKQKVNETKLMLATVALATTGFLSTGAYNALTQDSTSSSIQVNESSSPTEYIDELPSSSIESTTNNNSLEDIAAKESNSFSLYDIYKHKTSQVDQNIGFVIEYARKFGDVGKYNTQDLLKEVLTQMYQESKLQHTDYKNNTTRSSANAFGNAQFKRLGAQQIDTVFKYHFADKKEYSDIESIDYDLIKQPTLAGAKESAKGIVEFNKLMLELYHDPKRKNAEYNAGLKLLNAATKKGNPNNYNSYKRFLPQETQDYVPNIERLKQEYKSPQQFANFAKENIATNLIEEQFNLARDSTKSDEYKIQKYKNALGFINELQQDNPNEFKRYKLNALNYLGTTLHHANKNKEAYQYMQELKNMVEHPNSPLGKKYINNANYIMSFVK